MIDVINDDNQVNERMESADADRNVLWVSLKIDSFIAMAIVGKNSISKQLGLILGFVDEDATE